VDLSRCAAFEVTSEEAGSPLENALNPDAQKWVAATPGEQIIRLTFDEPQNNFEDLLVIRRNCPGPQSGVRFVVATGGSAGRAGNCPATVQFQPIRDHRREREHQGLPRKSECFAAVNSTRKKRRWTRLALAIAFTSKTISRVNSVQALPPFDCRLPLRDAIRVSKSTRWSHGH
jgi:hypothetical protein